VDHQVKHNVDVERAGSENAHAVDFKKQRVVEQRVRGPDGGIEALKVAYLGNAPMLRGEENEFFRLGQGGGDGLFHQHIDARFDQGARDAEMVARGNGNRGGLNFVPGKQLVQRAESTSVELTRHGVGSGGVGVDNGGQMDGLALPFQLVVDAGVVPPEGASADYGNLNTGG
jgi:hypothetical protein